MGVRQSSACNMGNGEGQERGGGGVGAADTPPPKCTRVQGGKAWEGD